MKSLLLASTSPRRKELLALLQVPFEVVDPKFDERIHAEIPPESQAWTFALGKAQSCARQHAGSLILGSDTLIAVGETILGKPADWPEVHFEAFFHGLNPQAAEALLTERQSTV